MAEDNRGDVLLVREAFREHHMEHGFSGADAGTALRVVERQLVAEIPPVTQEDDLLVYRGLRLDRVSGAVHWTRWWRHPGRLNGGRDQASWNVSMQIGAFSNATPVKRQPR